MITHCGKHTLTYGKPVIMGIVNVSPDSFSGDGLQCVNEALKRAYDLIDKGADIIDVGGESTRPGSARISPEEEAMRVVPLIYQLSHTSDVIISIDTMKTHVADVAIDAGASMVNDMNGLRTPGMAELISSKNVPVVIGHMHGTPETMQNSPMTGDFKKKIIDFLTERKKIAEETGIKDIITDPGIGFGKTPEQNMEICRNSGDYSLGGPVLIGASRKRFLSEYYPDMDSDEATAEICRIAVKSGADIVRVHDVEKTAAALRYS